MNYGGFWRSYTEIVDNNPHVLVYRRPNDGLGHTRLYVDGVEDTADDGVNLDTAFWAAPAVLTIGNDGAAGLSFGGYLFAIVLCPTYLEDFGRSSLETYLMRKLGAIVPLTVTVDSTVVIQGDGVNAFLNAGVGTAP